MKGPKMMPPTVPGAPGGAAPAVKMPGGGQHGPVKPRIKLRKLSTTGGPAFGPGGAGAAFATPGGGAPSPDAAFAGPAAPSGAGDGGA